MTTWGVIFLGVIALSSVVQAAFLISLIRGGRRVAQRLDELNNRVDRELRPSLDSLSRITRNLAEVTDVAVLQARRVDDLVAGTVERIEETSDVLRRFVLKPLGPLADILALLKGFRRGLEVYHQLRGLDQKSRGSTRRYSESDEHLFI